jgi:hypothetical protein
VTPDSLHARINQPVCQMLLPQYKGGYVSKGGCLDFSLFVGRYHVEHGLLDSIAQNQISRGKPSSQCCQNASAVFAIEAA